MGNHGEPKYVSGDKSPEQMDKEKKARKSKKEYLSMAENVLNTSPNSMPAKEFVQVIHHGALAQFSEHTRAMFKEFAQMYKEIESMGLDPVQLVKVLEKYDANNR